MESLQGRLDSFKKGKRFKNTLVKWPHPKSFRATPVTLAEAGFYYYPSQADKDNVKCFMCDKELGDWEEDDDPFDIHWRKCNTSCPWAIVRCGLKYDFDHDQNFKFSKSRAPHSKPMERARLQTFVAQEWWPHDVEPTHAATSTKMAQAGFIYTPDKPSDDTATCLYCNLQLGGWTVHDDPLQEHAKRDKERKTNCPFFNPPPPYFKAPLARKASRSKSKASIALESDQETQASNNPLRRSTRKTDAVKGKAKVMDELEEEEPEEPAPPKRAARSTSKAIEPAKSRTRASRATKSSTLPEESESDAKQPHKRGKASQAKAKAKTPVVVPSATDDSEVEVKKKPGRPPRSKPPVAVEDAKSESDDRDELAGATPKPPKPPRAASRTTTKSKAAKKLKSKKQSEELFTAPEPSDSDVFNTPPESERESHETLAESSPRTSSQKRVKKSILVSDGEDMQDPLDVVEDSPPSPQLQTARPRGQASTIFSEKGNQNAPIKAGEVEVNSDAESDEPSAPIRKPGRSQSKLRIISNASSSSLSKTQAARHPFTAKPPPPSSKERSALGNSSPSLSESSNKQSTGSRLKPEPASSRSQPVAESESDQEEIKSPIPSSPSSPPSKPSSRSLSKSQATSAPSSSTSMTARYVEDVEMVKDKPAQPPRTLSDKSCGAPSLSQNAKSSGNATSIDVNEETDDSDLNANSKKPASAGVPALAEEQDVDVDMEPPRPTSPPPPAVKKIARSQAKSKLTSLEDVKKGTVDKPEEPPKASRTLKRTQSILKIKPLPPDDSTEAALRADPKRVVKPLPIKRSTSTQHSAVINLSTDDEEDEVPQAAPKSPKKKKPASKADARKATSSSSQIDREKPMVARAEQQPKRERSIPQITKLSSPTPPPANGNDDVNMDAPPQTPPQQSVRLPPFPGAHGDKDQMWTVPLTEEEMDMTVEEWLRKQYAFQLEAYRLEGEQQQHNFVKRAAEVRKLVENISISS